MAELVYTLTQIAEGMSEERRKALRYITVHWAPDRVESRWNYAPHSATGNTASTDVSDIPGVAMSAILAPPDEVHALTSAVPMEEQIRDLSGSGLVGALDASRVDYGAKGIQAGYWAVAWNIVPWYQRKPGRPRTHKETREWLRVQLPPVLIQAIDARTTNRTAWIDAAIREKLERDG